jgi:hypothetical protein
MTHDTSNTRLTALGRGAVASLGAILLSAAVGCGIREYPHAGAPVDTSNDFGPSTGTAGTSIPVMTPIQPLGGAGVMANMLPIATGGVGTIMAGRPGVLPTAGIGAGVAGLGVTMPTAGMAASMTAGTMAPVVMPSGVTLDLGGTPVAKENVIAFIHFGHSNMAGRAIGPTATRPYFFTETDPHAWMYHAGMPPALAQEPYTADDNTMGQYGGPGTALIKQAVAMAPSKYFMSLGFGKESAYCTQFLPGALYYDSLIKAAKAIKDRVTFGAIVIMLGITERHGTAADVTGYSDCINKLVTAVRTDVGRPDLPLLITDYEQLATGTLAVGQAFAQSIIPEIHKIPMVVSNSALVPTDALGMQDDHHFNFDGHKVWTGRVLQIMKDKGWFPWK